MVVCACAEDKQACLHGNSCNAHAHLGTCPFSDLKLPSRIIEVPDNGGSTVLYSNNNLKVVAEKIKNKNKHVHMCILNMR